MDRTRFNLYLTERLEDQVIIVCLSVMVKHD